MRIVLLLCIGRRAQAVTPRPVPWFTPIRAGQPARSLAHRARPPSLQQTGSSIAKQERGDDEDGSARNLVASQQLIVVVLVGIPGSGKSTFADAILGGAGGLKDEGAWL
eukprot:scaffold21547_cov111-Isochrysis_galbana.AAC.3